MNTQRILNILSSGRGVGRWLKVLALCLAMILMVLGNATAQVEREGQAKPVMKTVTPKAVPVSVRESIIPTAVDIVLPPLDLTDIREEDKTLLEGKGVKRIGIVRHLPSPVELPLERASRGRWTDLKEGGSVWILTIQSTEAKAIRVHLENVKLSPGTQLMIYNTDNPKESYGPYREKDLFGQSGFWTESVFSSKITLECYIPPGADAGDISFKIQELAHVYEKFSDLLPKVGDCHNDVTCYAIWSNEADGVAGLGTVGVAGVLWCTGSLLNDFDNETWEDYFLTANHCLSGNNSTLGTQADADTTEYYWFYQTPTCNGTPPNPADVPRTAGGADLISNQTANAGNDHAFLRIRNETPGGVFYNGWTTGTPGGSPPPVLTGIHHPDGSWKRISFGYLDNSNTNYWLMEWYSGVTEPGSSGSPLYDDDRRVIGQLQGGDSSCSNPQGIDWYGRFNVTYPNIQRWLEIGGTIHVDGAYSGTELGTPTQPFNTVGEANNFAWNGVRIKIQAGSYPETLTFTKQVTLLATGGSVTIGQ